MKMVQAKFVVNAVTASLLISGAIAVPYEQYILAPSSRKLHPASVYNINGTVSGASSLTGDEPGSATFSGVSAVTYDYGKNIAGVVSVSVGNLSSSNQSIGLTFSESSLWISGEWSDATADAGNDRILWLHPTAPGTYTVAREHERGGFRYLSVVHNDTGSLELTQVETHFTPMPHYEDDALRNYTGWFHCEDELINRVWYAGAYTNQLCTIDPQHGDALIHFGVITSTTKFTTSDDWYYNHTITNGTSCLVDGAKRDRLVWAGDMSISVPGIVASTNDLITVRNSLDSLFNLQNQSNGQLPYVGAPLAEAFGVFSFTYHLYTLIGVANYYQYSGDEDWLSGKWDAYKFALNYSLSMIDSSGLMNVTSSADWLRFGMGGHNIEANAILYHTIGQSISLAETLNDTSVIPAWQTAASGVKSAANSLLWSPTLGLYTDNETTTLAPQDGNSWAIVANLTLNDTQASSISSQLASRWGAYGAPAVEADNAVSPFISGFELQGHILAGNATAALDLIRLEWGYMLDDPRMTNSTFIEGYSFDGALHYAPYKNDPRISHAHGWSTGATGTLSFYIGGIQLLSASGKTWLIEPNLGDLNSVDAGFTTSLGLFSSKVDKDSNGSFNLNVSTPEGTQGSIAVKDFECNGTLNVQKEGNATMESITIAIDDTTSKGRVEVGGLSGGAWNVLFTCS